jgi:molybdopterin synthase catalytic subunit
MFPADEMRTTLEAIEVSIIEGPLSDASSWPGHGGGAVVCFEGNVRELENGKKIDGLQYEAYRPMAEQQILRICRSLMDSHKLLAMRVEHSTGWVPVGKCSFRIQIEAMHRQEAIVAMQEFIDLLKKDVPIWKQSK